MSIFFVIPNQAKKCFFNIELAQANVNDLNAEALSLEDMNEEQLLDFERRVEAQIQSLSEGQLLFARLSEQLHAINAAVKQNLIDENIHSLFPQTVFGLRFTDSPRTYEESQNVLFLLAIGESTANFRPVSLAQNQGGVNGFQVKRIEEDNYALVQGEKVLSNHTLEDAIRFFVATKDVYYTE
jgi:hypothetical protein